MFLSIQQLDLHIGEKNICQDLQLNVLAGEFWAILGNNGVGKTTLLHSLCNLYPSPQGCIQLNKKTIQEVPKKSLAKAIGLMQQDYEYFFPCTVMEAVLMGRYPYLSSWQWESDEDRKIAEQALIKTNLVDLKDRQVKTLSGGEKRRLHLAMLLSQSPDIFLLDEPTNHLDLSTQILFLDLLQKHFHNQQKTGIMVVHDPNLAIKYCNKALLLFGDGKWQAGTSDDVLNSENLSQMYQYPIKKFTIDGETIFVPQH